MFQYRIEYIKSADKGGFIEMLNTLGAMNLRVVQILEYAERKSESDDDENAFFSARILVESLVLEDE